MPHPQIHEIRAKIIRKADDPAWFKRVHSSEKARYKGYLRDLVQEKKDRILLSQMLTTHELGTKEQLRYQSMLTYLHNGNRAKYEKYKTKTRQAMSDVLTFFMEQEGDFNAHFMPATRTPSFDIGDVTMVVIDESDIIRNEGASLRQGEKMKKFDDNLEFFYAIAEFVELFK